MAAIRFSGGMVQFADGGGGIVADADNGVKARIREGNPGGIINAALLIGSTAFLPGWIQTGATPRRGVAGPCTSAHPALPIQAVQMGGGRSRPPPVRRRGRNCKEASKIREGRRAPRKTFLAHTDPIV